MCCTEIRLYFLVYILTADSTKAVCGKFDDDIAEPRVSFVPHFFGTFFWRLELSQGFPKIFLPPTPGNARILQYESRTDYLRVQRDIDQRPSMSGNALNPFTNAVFVFVNPSASLGVGCLLKLLCVFCSVRARHWSSQFTLT